ncbi:type II/IV secretion system protein [Patescibacteria group bacterium]|nr:type II/IV secretion system protein [Patescibacteria group bacterium]
MLNTKILIDELAKIDVNTVKNWQKYEEDAKLKSLLLSEYLLKYGNYEENKLKAALAKAYGVGFVPQLPDRLMKMTEFYMPLSLAKAQSMVVFESNAKVVKIATSNPANGEVFDLLRKKIKKSIKKYFAFSYEIEKSLKETQTDFEEQFKNLKVGALKDITSIESLKNSSQLLDIILLNSLEYKSSDIHIEPHEERLVIRFRVDGVLQDIIDLPLKLADIITTRIKVLASLRIDEHQKPQDGRFKLSLPDGNEITTRVSILPIYEGEKVVMRILSAKSQKTQLKDLGFTDDNQSIIYSNIDKAHGMLLVTGPTGSGKTTTLYTILKMLNKPEVNLVTIEDPIEYRLDRVNQIQVNNAADLTFASGLRSILRQDPDVIMVGEIRDEETAGIAVNAALTGHLVLATLHTNSAIDSLPRLLEMGVEPYLVASTANVVVAQRLARSLCEKCKKEIEFSQEILDSFKLEDSDFSKNLNDFAKKYIPVGTKIFQAKGCSKCGDTGYSGRIALAEVLSVTEDIQKLIYGRKSPLEILVSAKENGFKELIEDALLKVQEGKISLEEIVRVLKE